MGEREGFGADLGVGEFGAAGLGGDFGRKIWEGFRAWEDLGGFCYGNKVICVACPT